MNMPNPQLHMGKSALKKAQELTEWLLHMGKEKRKKPTSKWEGEAEIQSLHKPNLQHSDPQSGGNSQTWSSPWGAKRLNHISGFSAFKTCTWEMSPQNNHLWKRTGLTTALTSPDPPTLPPSEKQLEGLALRLTCPGPRQRVQNGARCGRGSVCGSWSLRWRHRRLI